MCWNDSTGGATSLDIPNNKTCSLASELPSPTGEFMADAITVVLRERWELERRRRDVVSRAGRRRAIAERCTKLPGSGPSAIEQGEVPYDECGLPKRSSILPRYSRFRNANATLINSRPQF